MDESSVKQSPIFSKTYDFTLWLLNHTEHFPKSERFRLAKRMEDSAFGFYELLLQATRGRQKRRWLLMADYELAKLRYYSRIAFARKLTSPQQYHYQAGVLIEIGKLLGGWLRTLPEDS